jgi:hypothetical protein
MNRSLARFAVFAMLLGTSASALAEQGPWGTPAESKPCQATLDSPECKAEISRRAQNCLADPREDQRTWQERGDKSKEAHDARRLSFCTDVATDIMKRQMDRLADDEKRAAEAKAKVEGVELPKADQHNAGLEKAVAAAYAKDYPGGKIVTVILGRWSDDYEKDAFGRVTGRDLFATIAAKKPDGTCTIHGELWLQHGKGKSFSGPLSPRGAGSAEDHEILCDKLEAGKAPKKR